MSLTSSCERSGRRRSHSTPRKESKTGSKSHNLNSSIDSTYSLLSPIYHDSFESSDEDQALEQDITTDRSKDEEPRSPDCQDNGTHSKASELSQQELNLTPWETWIICKEKQMRIELENKLSEKLKQEEERLKLQQEKEMKKLLAEEQHKQWVQKKLEQEKKEKEQQLLRAQRKKELEEMQKMTIQEKSREKYQEWLRKKEEEDQERKRKEKEEEEKRLAEQKEKREKAEMTFKEWVERAKTRPRAPLNSYGYANGKLTVQNHSNQPQCP
ncbi:coiled-coil domain-containing protein 34 isoform X2 [Spea bombifrons]|uniref:coiled-coil domain-containing protein 34 isoform X2 n=1 Tax=Spea bombifrons TaxID=233779 RepID=UPI00234A15B1|nr:coiled-coil domain-containing protein 34 isoform X2 [Spea bombifrons]